MNLTSITNAVASSLFYSHHCDRSSPESIGISCRMFYDLISRFSWLFDVTSEEMEKERKIQQTLATLRESKLPSQNFGDGILVHVYVGDKENGSCYNVSIGTHTTAQDVIEYIEMKEKIGYPTDGLSLFEVVCSGQLERFLHYSEVVLSVILSWKNWSVEDARTNYLIVKENTLYQYLVPILGLKNIRSSSIPLSMFSQLKYSDVGCGKNFKKYLFEFVGAKLSIYKDARAEKIIGQWNIENIIWYIGSESKRGAPNSRWCFTFFERDIPIERKKDGAVGRVVSCNNQSEYYKWLAGMILAQYPNGLTPIKPLIDLLE